MRCEGVHGNDVKQCWMNARHIVYVRRRRSRGAHRRLHLCTCCLRDLVTEDEILDAETRTAWRLPSVRAEMGDL